VGERVAPSLALGNMTSNDFYGDRRRELLELGAALTSAAAMTPVPALPGWTVHDTYSHLTGICSDMLDGKPILPGDPVWSAQHVDTRREWPFGDVLDEWERRGQDFDAVLATLPPMILLMFDIWHHSHDIRGAVGRPAHRDTEPAMFIAHEMAVRRQQFWAENPGLPPIALSTPSATWCLGEGEPAATLRTSDFELGRMLIGRRSRAQMLAAGWTGDPRPVIDHLHVFGPPELDLVE
jgi:uncharacterized protein (TIGR03083 family)